MVEQNDEGYLDALQRRHGRSPLDIMDGIAWLLRTRWYAAAALITVPPFLHLATIILPPLTRPLLKAGNAGASWSSLARVDIPVLGLIACGLGVGLCNLVFTGIYRRLDRHRPQLMGHARKIRWFASIQIGIDIAIITLAISYVCGTVETPAPIYLIFHLICATSILTKRETYIQAAMGTALFALLLNLEIYGVVPHRQVVYFDPPLALASQVHYIIVYFAVFSSILFLSVFLTNYLTRKIDREQEELKVKAIELYTFYNTVKMISSVLDIEKVFDTVMTQYSKTYRIDKYSLLLLDRTTGELYLKAAHGLPESLTPEFRMTLQDGIPGEVVRSGELQVAEGAPEGEPPRFYGETEIEPSAYICLPLFEKERAIGALTAHKRPGRRFNPLEIQLLKTIAANVALAITNTELFRTVEHQAMTDGLTGLFNRRVFMERLEEEQHRADRYKRPLSVLMMDVDKFKQFNDNHGHLAGDAVLSDVGKLLAEMARRSDTPARYGGEEFAMLLPETAAEDAEKMAERIRARIESHEFTGENIGGPYHATISIGVACAPGGDLKPQALVNRADRALYEAKRDGRNRVSTTQMKAVNPERG